MPAPVCVDFHTHTTASDGSLSPAALVAAAESANVDVLAITDHDTLRGIAAAKEAVGSDLKIVPGVEISAIWRRRNIHVVGLGIDVSNNTLKAALLQQQNARIARGAKIAKRLTKQGLPDLYPAARQIAGTACIGRPHLADAMVKAGIVKDRRSAFRRYLGDGKPAVVRAAWAELADVVRLIHQASGVSVLAHPLAYKLTRTKLHELCRDFSDMGGQAIELHSGRQTAAETAALTALAETYEFEVSVGSDFHQPGHSRHQLGHHYPIPASLTPVWPALLDRL